MKRRYSLKGFKSFKEIIVNGKRFSIKGIRAIVSKQGAKSRENMSAEPRLRCGIAVNKHFGNAVERNKVKRRVRSVLITLLPELQQGYDVIIFPGTICKTMQYNHLFESVKQLLFKSGVFKQ